MQAEAILHIVNYLGIMEGNNKQGYLADLALGMQYKFWASFRQQHKKPLKSFFVGHCYPLSSEH